MTDNIVDFGTASLAARLDARARRLAPTAEFIAAEHERLMPIKAAAEELANRLRAGELPPSFMMEVADFLDVPKEKLDNLHCLLGAIEETLCDRKQPDEP